MARLFPELSYARPHDRPLRRIAIRSIEEIGGRSRLARLYGDWRIRHGAGSPAAFGAMLDIMRIRLDMRGALPAPGTLPERLVIVANHPFGIGDGIAILSLAERLGRPFRILINADLMKIPEMAAYSLPVVFEETREALETNLATRREAIRLLAAGTTIVVFPAGGVATAPKPFGPAQDLPWKLFTARLVQSGGASVLPIHFEGQNGPIFHLASRLSPTLRIALLIAEFRKLAGSTMRLSVGDLVPFEALSAIPDRAVLTDTLRRRVFSLARDLREAA